METACRKMAESYVDYEMTGRNLGMCEHLDKEHFYRLTRGYFEAAVRNGSLYSAGDKQEGYFIFETPETKRSLSGSLLQATWSLRAFGLKKGIRYVKEIMNLGTYLASEFGRQKKPFTKIEFIAVSSYGNEYASSGNVQITRDLQYDITGRDLIVVEDLLDSGNTLYFLRPYFMAKGAASVTIVTLFDKPERRAKPIKADYIGFTVPNEFVVGYGLDFRQQYRNLPYVGVLKPEIYAD